MTSLFWQDEISVGMSRFKMELLTVFSEPPQFRESSSSFLFFPSHFMCDIFTKKCWRNMLLVLMHWHNAKRKSYLCLLSLEIRFPGFFETKSSLEKGGKFDGTEIRCWNDKWSSTDHKLEDTVAVPRSTLQSRHAQVGNCFPPHSELSPFWWNEKNVTQNIILSITFWIGTFIYYVWIRFHSSTEFFPFPVYLLYHFLWITASTKA